MKCSFIFNESKDYSFDTTLDIVKKFLNYGTQISALEKYKNKFENLNLIFYEDLDELIKNSEIAVVCGGDGTIMHIAKIAAKYNVPVFGINYGKTGFMSTIESGNLLGIEEFIYGKYKISRRMMLKVVSNSFETYALNDLVLNRKLDSQIVDYKVFVDSEKICSYSSDGLIISTPTGSTAYSLAAGGPIVESNMNCFLITPICAHTLSARSIVLCSSMPIDLEYLPKSGGGLVATVDGNIFFEDNKNGLIKVKKAEFDALFIELNSSSFYSNIDTKLVNKFVN